MPRIRNCHDEARSDEREQRRRPGRRRDRQQEFHPSMDIRWATFAGVREMIIESLSEGSMLLADITTYYLLLRRLFEWDDIRLFMNYAQQVPIRGTTNSSRPNWQQQIRYAYRFVSFMIDKPELNEDLKKLMYAFIGSFAPRKLSENFSISWLPLVETFLTRFISRRVSFVCVSTPVGCIHGKRNSNGDMIEEVVVYQNGGIRCLVEEPVVFS
jgi:hypothetical protein